MSSWGVLSTVPVHEEAHACLLVIVAPFVFTAMHFPYQCCAPTSLSARTAILSVHNYSLSVDTGGALQSGSALGEEHLEPRTAQICIKSGHSRRISLIP